MALNIGVNVVEVDGRAAPTVVAAPISVAGFLVRTERGPVNVPVAVRGPGDFAATFGGTVRGLFGPHAVRGFFDNGGTDAVVVRVVGTDAKAATAVLTDRGGNATLEVKAGGRGREDRGAWGNALSVQVVDHPLAVTALPAQLVGDEVEPFAVAAGDLLEVTVDGDDEPVTVEFEARDLAGSPAGAVPAAAVVAAVARRTTRLRVAVDPAGHLILASAVSGPDSRLQVAGTAAEALGFETIRDSNASGGLTTGATRAVLDSIGGLSVGSAVRIHSGRARVEAANPVKASDLAEDEGSITVAVDGGTAQTITVAKTQLDTAANAAAAITARARGVEALAEGDKLVLRSTSGRYGTGSTLTLGAGTPDATKALGLEGAVAETGATVGRSLTGVDESARTITWEGALATAVPADTARIESAEFDLVVRRGGTELERFASVSMQGGVNHNVAAVVNDPDLGSRFIVVADRNSTSGVADDVPRAETVPLGATTAGVDAPPSELDFIGDPAARTGLSAFDTVDIQLLACPDRDTTGVVAACLAYAERRGDAMFVGAAPRDRDLEGVKAYAAPLRARKVYGALYAPWIEIVNPLDTAGTAPRLAVPPVGHVLGMYARISEARGVWKAPAGDEAMLVGALGVGFDMTDADHTDLVKAGGVNGIRAIPGSGIVVDASRTLSTDTRWLFVNVRRLFNFVKSSLSDGLIWVAQEPNSDELRRRVRFNVVTPFLLGLWRQGAFGSDPPEQVFTVKCDEENNPATAVNLGEFRVEVFFYPVKPAETIVIIVGQQDSGAAAAEA
jgi:hypothetical protein